MRRLFRIAPIALAAAIIVSCAAIIFGGADIARAADEAPSNPAEQQIRNVVQKLRGTVAAEKDKTEPAILEQKLRDILLPVFDFDEMAKSSLGANWHKATPDQQQEFVHLFSNLLAKSYLSKIRRNIEESEMTFLPPQTRNDRVVVRSVIHSEGDDIQADYRMIEKNSVWRVYDVLVENVGLVSNYRNEFSSILQRNSDFNALLQTLRDRTSGARKA